MSEATKILEQIKELEAKGFTDETSPTLARLHKRLPYANTWDNEDKQQTGMSRQQSDSGVY